MNNKRKSAYWGSVPYVYGSKNHKFTHKEDINKWDSSLIELLRYTNMYSGGGYNSALGNLYRNGLVSLNLHQDDEDVLKENVPIATISMGAQRTFILQGIEGEKSKTNGLEFFIELEHNSILLFNNQTNSNFRHGILEDKDINEPRYSITLREMEGGKLPYKQEWIEQSYLGNEGKIETVKQEVFKPSIDEDAPRKSLKYLPGGVGYTPYIFSN